MSPSTTIPQIQGRTQAGLHGDYVFALDHGIGRLLTALDETGHTDNTLVIVATQPEEYARLKALHLQIRGSFTPNANS